MTKQEINEITQFLDSNYMLDVESEVIKIYAISEMLRAYVDDIDSGESLDQHKRTILFGAIDTILDISDDLFHSRLNNILNELSDIQCKIHSKQEEEQL